MRGIGLFKADVGQLVFQRGVRCQAQAGGRHINANDLRLGKGAGDGKTTFAKAATHVQHLVKVTVLLQPLNGCIRQ